MNTQFVKKFIINLNETCSFPDMNFGCLLFIRLDKGYKSPAGIVSHWVKELQGKCTIQALNMFFLQKLKIIRRISLVKKYVKNGNQHTGRPTKSKSEPLKLP